MFMAKITSKGQLTLPADMRAALDLRAGDYVHFFTDLEGQLRFAIDRRRDRPVPVIARYSGPPLDIRELDPGYDGGEAEAEPAGALVRGTMSAA
jgi:antitoxin PrlF